MFLDEPRDTQRILIKKQYILEQFLPHLLLDLQYIGRRNILFHCDMLKYGMPFLGDCELVLCVGSDLDVVVGFITAVCELAVFSVKKLAEEFHLFFVFYLFLLVLYVVA